MSIQKRPGTTRAPKPAIDIRDDQLYITDNGAVYCGAHLGATARFTGRDISGKPIEPVTPEDVREAQAWQLELRCENPTCGRAA